MPKVICKKIGCKKLIDKGKNNGYCDEHKEFGEKLKQENDKHRFRSYNQDRKDSKETKLYNSKEWKKLKDYTLKKFNYLCQECLSNGKITSTNLEVHHIIPIKDDFSLSLDENNLTVLCRACHKKAHEKLNKYKIK